MKFIFFRWGFTFVKNVNTKVNAIKYAQNAMLFFIALRKRMH